MKDDQYGHRFHAAEEATQAIVDLSREQKRRLERIARKWAWFSGDHRGLLHEAIASTVEGKRRWNRSVDIVRHLDQVMRSIASNALKRRETASDDLENTASRTVWQDDVPSTEQILIERETREERRNSALAMCGDDEEVKLLVNALIDNKELDECVRLFGGTSKYNTVRKRMNRKISKFQSKGGTNDQLQ